MYYDNDFKKELKEAMDIQDPEEKRRTLKDLISKMIEKDMAWIQEQNRLENVANNWAEGLQRKIDTFGNRDAIVTPIVKDGKITFEIKIPCSTEEIFYPLKIFFYSKKKKRKNIRNQYPSRAQRTIDIPYDMYRRMRSSN